MNKKVLVVLGPTASGKSSVALKIAKEFDGEIISADSLTIHKNMDIGTAKPTKAEQKKTKHWAIDIIGPKRRFTVAQFQKYAKDKIEQIQSRGHLPIVVGGTGLYIDSLVFDFSFLGRADPKLRKKLEVLSVEELQQIIQKKGYKMPFNKNNKRHLIGLIERQGQIGTRNKKPPEGIIFVGLMPTSDDHKIRIQQRVEEMFKNGLVGETKRLIKIYGRRSLKAKAAVAYGPVIDYLQGSLTLDEAKANLRTLHWQYARRQKAWFKRNPYIQWFSSVDDAYSYISDVLNN
ncbi:MAG TPA: tRNA (adenosine(37)-N6)-dimethylallyltransferase MiaA [Candidatus Saccharimonadales bacterium]|nr:tRNA (adenosine(37)-N6)-dimethylallyltransferase MiaA [Candidatus Saccharimonadales bacterium]